MRVLTMALVVGAVIGYAQSGAAVYEGARLIVGDTSPAIENGSLVVQNGHIAAIGRRDAVRAPAGARHVDLAGKTVLPTMNNVHIHIGYEGYVSWSTENHTRENVLDHLEREAFYSVGAAMTMGDQPLDSAQSENCLVLNVCTLPLQH